VTVRCPACRTRRTTFTALLAHLEKSEHVVCKCGGYHYPHRPGSRFCDQNPMSDVWRASHSGASDEELQEIQTEIAYEKKGRPFNKWRD